MNSEINTEYSKMIHAPVFLVGAERSGSTMLRLMLNDHPDVCWLNEFEYAVDQINGQGLFPDMKVYRQWLACHRTFTATGFKIDKSLDYLQLVNSFLVQKKMKESKAIVGATVHRHFDRLLRIWPDAKFIHIIRDPRDVARSVLKLGWVGNIYYGPLLWKDAELTWNRIVSTLPDDRYAELRFEDLLKNPEQELKLAWGVLGVDAKNYKMKYWEDTTYEPPDPNLAYQWLHKLKPYEIQLIEYRLGTLINEKGYRESNFSPINLSKLNKLTLMFNNRIGRAVNRRRRYGTLMWISSILSPRLPFKGWHKSIRMKLNEIERRQLK